MDFFSYKEGKYVFNSAKDNGIPFKINNTFAKFLGFKFDGINWNAEKKPEEYEILDRKDNYLVISNNYINYEIAVVSFELKDDARNDGFKWNKDLKLWVRGKAIEINTDFIPSFNESIQNLLKTPLFEYQKEGVARMLSRKRFLNSDEMGLGKSLQAVACCVLPLQRKEKVLVICPAFLKLNWKIEFEKHCLKTPKILILDSKNLKNVSYEDYDIFIINYDILEKLNGINYKITTIICDEAHALKSRNNKRVNFFKELIKTYSHNLYFLTGTPIKNRIPELFNFFRWCGGIMYKYDDFCSYFSYMIIQNIHGKKLVKFEGLKNERELKHQMSSWYFKRKSEDVLELPPLKRIDIISDVEKKKDLEVFKALEEAYKAFINGEKSDHIMKIKKEASMLKCSDTVALANEILENGESLVIFEHFIEPAVLIHSAIDGSCFIDGGTNMQKRQEYVEKFQNGEIKCIVATIGSLSTGVTLTKANKMIFNSLSWVPADNLQAEKRIHRIGTSQKCFIYRMLKTHFDTKITNILDKKEDVIERALN